MKPLASPLVWRYSAKNPRVIYCQLGDQGSTRVGVPGATLLVQMERSTFQKIEQDRGGPDSLFSTPHINNCQYRKKKTNPRTIVIAGDDLVSKSK